MTKPLRPSARHKVAVVVEVEVPITTMTRDLMHLVQGILDDPNGKFRALAPAELGALPATLRVFRASMWHAAQVRLTKARKARRKCSLRRKIIKELSRGPA